MDGNPDTGAADDGPDHVPAGADPPLTVEVLADLQAGLLDDEAAARVRKQVRADPHAEGALRALHRVRRDVAAAGADPTSAPDVPPEVTARISAALTAVDPVSGGAAAHSAPPHGRPTRTLAAAAGLCAVLAAIGVGTAALLHAPAPTPSTPTTAQHITVSTPPMVIPLTAGRDPRAARPRTRLRARSATRRGARPASAASAIPRRHRCWAPGRSRSTLALACCWWCPADTPDSLAVFAVAPNCSAADTGLLASTQVPRP